MARDEGDVEGQSTRYRVSVAPGLPEEGTAARDEGDVEGQSVRYSVRVAPWAARRGNYSQS